MHADVYEGRGADRDQYVRAKAAAALAVLTLRPDQAAENEGCEKADE
jgi:hypothetical protein